MQPTHGCPLCELCPGFEEYKHHIKIINGKHSSKSSTFAAAKCGSYGGCQGSYDTYCYPSYIWSGSVADSSSYHRGFGFESGTFANFSNSCGTGMYGKCIDTYVFGVRCLLLALYGHRVMSHPYHPRLWYVVSWI